MEFLYELLFDLIMEVGIEASESIKVPKFIRYLIIAVISLFFIAIIGLIFYVGVISLNKNIFAGVFFMLFALIMLILCILKFRKTYINKMK